MHDTYRQLLMIHDLAARIERITCQMRPLPCYYSCDRTMDLHHLTCLWHHPKPGVAMALAWGGQ